MARFLSKKQMPDGIQIPSRNERTFLTKKRSKLGRWTCLFGTLGYKRVGEGHKLVDNDKGDAESGAERKDLLADGVTKSSWPVGFCIHDFRHGSVRDDISSALDDLAIKSPTILESMSEKHLELVCRQKEKNAPCWRVNRRSAGDVLGEEVEAVRACLAMVAWAL